MAFAVYLSSFEDCCLKVLGRNATAQPLNLIESTIQHRYLFIRIAAMEKGHRN